MRARRVKGLDPDAPLADEAERIVRVRLDELCSFVPAAMRPERERTRHDMRIAAKRLRYVLELTGFCFGPYARTAAKKAKQLQDVLGEIHDCEVLAPNVRAEIERVRADDARMLRDRALDDRAQDLGADAVRHAPHRAEYRGLELLAVHADARRELLLRRFQELWTTLERQRFRERLERALDQRREVYDDLGAGRGGASSQQL